MVEGVDAGLGALEDVFQEVAKLVRDTPPTLESNISNDEKLRLYGLYKHITVGPCDGCKPPSIFNVVARAKYQAWASCVDETLSSARLSYIRLISNQNNDVGRKCKVLLQSYLDDNQQQAQITRKESSTLPKQPIIDEVEKSITQPPLGLDKQYFGASRKTKGAVKRLIPRGQIDICYMDLLFASIQCLRSLLNNRYCQEEKKIVKNWVGSINDCAISKSEKEKEVAVVAGLSVRSLLDLFLMSKSYAPGSEVIVVPPINIPGMIDVLEFHELKVIPIDLPPSPDGSIMVKVDIDSVTRAITKKTVAIMIVHPFGIICSTEKDMKKLSDIASDHNIDIIEDCAQCFVGLGQNAFHGSSYADISLFSFGVIKTATALGGGVALLRNSSKENSTHMTRIQNTVYKQQASMIYLFRVLQCVSMKCISDSLILYGFLFMMTKLMGLSFDVVVSSTTQNFTAPKYSTISYRQKEKFDKAHYRRVQAKRRRGLLVQLRKRPSPALLSLMNRRFSQSHQTFLSVQRRIRQCEKMTFQLKEISPNILIPHCQSNSKHIFWLYPIVVKEPDVVSRILLEKGFDVPRGTSKLGCVSSYLKTDDNLCPLSQKLFNGVLYLPMASQHLSEKNIHRLASVLKHAVEPKQGNRNESQMTAHGQLGVQIVVLLFSIFLVGSVTFTGKILLMIPQACAFGLMILLLIYFIGILLRWSIGDFYLSSDTFAKYCYLLGASGFQHYHSPHIADRLGEPKNIDLQSRTILTMKSLKLPDCSNGVFGLKPDCKTQNHGDKHPAVFLTGATGFVGSLILRDLLLHRDALGIPGGVVVLCRAKKNKTGAWRIGDLLKKPMYSFLSEKEKSELVTVVEGDVTLPDIGLTSHTVKNICENMNISHVIHCAASVSFTQTMEEAAVSNITSSLNVQSLAKQLNGRSSKSVKFVHISTAFVHGRETGTALDPLPEQLHSIGPFDPIRIYQSMLETQSYAFSAMNELGFPNTYTFSKCICEHLLSNGQDVDTIIVRPSIVGPALQDPFEGWAGDRPTTIVAAPCLYMMYQWNLWYFGKQSVPCIPVDVVSKFVLAKAFNDCVCEIGGDSGSDGAQSSFESDDFEKVSKPSGENNLPSCPSDKNENGRNIFKIYNAAWDVKSCPTAMFCWLDYAVAITQLGAVLGYFNRSTAYTSLFVIVKLLPCVDLTYEKFCRLHKIVVQIPIGTVLSLFKYLDWQPRPIRQLMRLSAYLDLPLLFFPFMTNEFHFSSTLVAPDDMNGERYMFTCIVAAEDFFSKFSKKSVKKTVMQNSSRDIRAKPLLVVGGCNSKRSSSDLWWALTQPKGNIVIRLAGWFLTKILCAACVEVTVDTSSFSIVAFSRTSDGGRPHVILAPTHRSFFDFLLLSYICFAVPEMGVDIPYIAAADDFARLPILGWLAGKAKAFFIKRGRSSIDPSLRNEIRAIKEENGDGCSTCVEVFIEGKRSRDRRFVAPKTGFLRCLESTGGEHLILPVSINYERIPEQSTLSDEINLGQARGLSTKGLFSWLKRVFLGKINIGRIHISAGAPLNMNSTSQSDVSLLVQDIQKVHQENVLASRYHIEAGAIVLGVDTDIICEALSVLEVRFWPESKQNFNKQFNLELPLSPSELWTIMLQYGHVFAPFFVSSHHHWCKWLDPVCSKTESTEPDNAAVCAIIQSLSREFDAADDASDNAFQLLRSKGFESPKLDHVVQCMERTNTTIAPLLLRAAATMRLQKSTLSSPIHDCSGLNGYTVGRLKLQKPYSPIEGINETLGSWGFSDSGFVLHESACGRRSVVMKGKRYEICGRKLKKIVPFIENETQVSFNPEDATLPQAISLPESIRCDLSSEDILTLKNIGRMSIEVVDRARHGTGHSQEDMHILRSGNISKIRLPDVIVWPSSRTDVEKLVWLCGVKNWCLIPFGGGTNVSHATRCPSKDAEPRPIISLDMKLMNRILWINEEDGLAHVEAGITGKDLAEGMEKRGYTIGHEPDSIEFSTLGGWIATKASGMKRSKYGNIEDVVKSVHVVGSGGTLSQDREQSRTAFGRESSGIELNSLIIGSEGCLGVITSAIIRLWPLPECRDYDSIILEDFNHGLRFVRDVARLGHQMPASVRLLDNEHFRLGQALQHSSSAYEIVKTELTKLAGSLLTSFSSGSIVCVTIVYEGRKNEVCQQRSRIAQLATLHGGFMGGPDKGRAGYDLTFVIAYLRDFAMTYNFLGDSFETFAPWSKLETIVSSTKNRIREEHVARCLPGVPFIGCRITQLYHEGACVYFYVCMNVVNVTNPSMVFGKIEHAARCEIIANGGSLSHHHGVGKIRASFMKEKNGEVYQKTLHALKKSIDPRNIFGVRNGAFHEMQKVE